MFNNITFSNPEFLWLIIGVIFFAVVNYKIKHLKNPKLSISSIDSFNKSSLKTTIFPFLDLLRYTALVSLIIALARPQIIDISTQTKKSRGIDIVIAVDVSSSMLAQDLKPNRLEALKEVAKEFIYDRVNDRIGLVVYAGESYTKTPVTTDKSIIVKSLDEIIFDGIIEDGTAIGMGLATSVNRLKNSKAKSKVIILLTDGVNNSGFVDPKTATELAKELNIKVYTVGIGTNGMADFPFSKDARGRLQFRKQQVEIDEELLQFIASETQGQYFRATDNSELQEIYDEIDTLEKTKIEEFKYYNYQEKYRFLIFLAGGLLLLEFVLKNTLFRSFI